MNQQLLKGVNSIESLQETGGYSPTQVAKSRYSSLVVSKKYRVLFLIAGVLVILVVCAAVFAAVGVSQSLSAHSENVEKRITDDQLIELATKEQLLKQAANFRAKRRSRDNRKIATCYSTLTNESYPAAHISGTGSKWNPLDPDNNLANGDWDTKWVCANDSDAYVDGGMIFNVTDKKLYVPVCGYYHITSQMYFYVTETVASPEDRLKYVSLEIYVNKHCDSGDNFVLLRSYASLVLTPSNNKDIGKTTVHIEDVVKICGGGTIHVHIPDDRYNPCCPHGSKQTTYLSAFLVSETSCDPPRSYDHLPTVVAI